jgi:hypothetical protein
VAISKEKLGTITEMEKHLINEIITELFCA